jgi:hypothetical protein
VDPSRPEVNLLPVHAGDRLSGKETIRSMARRYGATAAVNGGYFVVNGPYAGTSSGVYQFDHRPVFAGSNRTALVFCEETGFVERLEMDVIQFRGKIEASDGSTLAITGMNRQRAADELVLFLPQFGVGTLADATGVEVILDKDSRVLSLEDGKGNAAIPPGGSVLSGAGAAAEWLRRHAEAASALRVETALDRATPGCAAEDIVGAGPRIVRDGKVAVNEEGFAHANVRHPRTAVAVTSRRTFLFVTLDGRQAASVGMRLDELAGELIALGAVEAMNLDGGGSTTMVAGDRIRNSPSDPQERAVSDGILIFSTGTEEELRTLLDHLGNDPVQIEPSLRAALLESLRAGRLDEFHVRVAPAEGAGLSVPAARLLREALAAVASSGVPVQ